MLRVYLNNVSFFDRSLESLGGHFTKRKKGETNLRKLIYHPNGRNDGHGTKLQGLVTDVYERFTY